MSRTASVPNGIGASIPRVEDEALLTGRGQFIDDINIPGQAYAHFVRSPYACARILRIETAEALSASGVVAVLIGEDMAQDGAGQIIATTSLENRDGSLMFIPKRTAMAIDRARYVGEAVAMVIAETLNQAVSGAERIQIDYEELPSVTNIVDAAAPDANVIWEEIESNVALEWEIGDQAMTEDAFAFAAHITEIELVNNRIYCGAIEPRGVVASYDPHSRRYTVFTPTQGLNMVHLPLAKGLNADLSAVHLITPDVGGGFGTKNSVYPEQISVPWAAKRIGRPVKWYSTRSEAFLTDYHARDHVMRAALALDEDGGFLGMRCQTTSSMGAYHTGTAALIPTTGGSRTLTNVYHFPAVFAESTCVFTNNTPTHAFRGAGKPEFCYVAERLIDKAARELETDPTELRRRNLISPEDMPYRTPTGMVYDSGDFDANMSLALNEFGLADLTARKEKARARGKLIGVGYALYTEPDGFLDNRVSIQFDPTGELTMTMTGISNGQGHQTTFGQVIVSQLGVSLERITVVQGDSDRVGPGSGTGGSRTTTVAGGAIVQASEKIIDKGKRIASRMLGADVSAVEFKDGLFAAHGNNRKLSLAEVAKASFNLANLPDGEELGLEANSHYVAKAYSYPSGCHVAEVEIDQDTGSVQVTRYLMVDDLGTVINPMLARGQLHGGVVTGLGQALNEEVVYEPDTGQLLTGSFLDYHMPRASDVPEFAGEFNGTRCLTNPLGVKGAGEAGTTASMPAIVNAVIDALWEFGVTEIDMPLTPERVWRAMSGQSCVP